MQRKTQNGNQNRQLSQRTVQGSDGKAPPQCSSQAAARGCANSISLVAQGFVCGQLQRTGCCIARSAVKLCIPALSTRTFGSSTQNRKHQLCRQQRVKSTMPFCSCQEPEKYLTAWNYQSLQELASHKTKVD